MNSLERKLIVSIAGVVVLMIAAGFVAFKALNDSIEISREVSNSRETLTEVESTLLTLKDAEEDQRDYISADREHALARLRVVREEAHRKLARLKTLTANNANHQERLTRVEPALHKKLARTHETIIRRPADQFLTAKATAISDEEKGQIEDIGQLLGDIKTEENDALERRVAMSEASVRNVTISFGSLFVLIVALLTLVFVLVRKDLVTQRQLQQRLNELATTDELTRLYNRREINRCFRDEVERFQRYKQPFSLLLLDIDHFKSVNDNYGHQGGDAILQGVAMRIRDRIRTTDIAGRFGGEEFAVILPNTLTSDAYTLAERMRQAIATKPFTVDNSDGKKVDVRVSISIGVSGVGGVFDTEEDVIRSADTALYQAKNEGRDRTVMFQEVAAVQ